MEGVKQSLKGPSILPRLWIAAIATVVALLGLAPAAAQATVTHDQHHVAGRRATAGRRANSPYLISYDNQPTTARGHRHGAGRGHRRLASTSSATTASSSQFKTLDDQPARSRRAARSPPPPAPRRRSSKPIAGHALPSARGPPQRARAPATAVRSPAPRSRSPRRRCSRRSPAGPNNGDRLQLLRQRRDVHRVRRLEGAGDARQRPAVGACGGPYAAPVDPAFDIGNFPIDCAGSLFGDDLGTWGGRSEVQIDGRNAYDAASAQGLFPRTSGHDNGSQDLPGFPSLSVVGELGSGERPDLLALGRVVGSVRRHRSVQADLDGGLSELRRHRRAAGPRSSRPATAAGWSRLTDTWSSTDGQSHSLDLLYDDYAGVFGNADGERGWQFPGQSGFTQYGAGASVAPPDRRARLDPGAHERERGRRGSERGLRGDHVLPAPPPAFASPRAQRARGTSAADRAGRRQRQPELRVLGRLLAGRRHQLRR